jgi:hypothetical protein
MTIFYHKLDFDLSQEAKQWVIDLYREKFKTTFYHDCDTSQIADEVLQQQWQQGPVGRELLPFLATYGLDASYYGITTFISNTAEPYPGNPHIDFKFNREMVQSPIKSRINIMILGNPDDEMVWWDWLGCDDTRLSEAEYTSDITGQTFTCRNVPGDSKPERLKYVGEPTHRAGRLLSPSAFIKTDCAHTANLSTGPRLLVTVAFGKTIEEILSLNNI